MGKERVNMKILYAASEARPFIASGGLADVAGSLPKAIRSKQHQCRVVLPLYGTMKPEDRAKLTFITSFQLQLSWRSQYCGIFQANEQGVVYYFIDNEYYFKRGSLYGHGDDAERFAFFSKAVLEMLNYIDYEPDIINCNDWQTALVPVFLRCFYMGSERHRRLKTVFTIHNIQYQGQFGMDILGYTLGLPSYQAGILEYGGCINYMKGAIETCDMVTTVSPTYAQEILTPWFAHGLDGLLRDRQYKLCGIVNGIDLASNDPAVDKAMFHNFSVDTVNERIENKLALQRQMGLEESSAMLIGIVTRLVSHKGVDLIQYIFEDMMKLDVQIVLLGSGDQIYEDFFRAMQGRYPGRVSTTIGFIPDLAKKIYGSTDAFLMPSKSEPCGLAQMIALRYGSIPIIRETGGLKDTITDLGGENGNGFTFQSYNAHDMLGAIERCKNLYDQPEKWHAAVKHALQCDFSWDKSADAYIEMYHRVLES